MGGGLSRLQIGFLGRIRMTRIVLLIATVFLSIGGAWAADSPAKSVPPSELTQKLEKAIDGRLDIELKSGDSYVRCKLLKVTGGGKDGMPKTVKFQETDDSKPITVGFNGVRSISIDREQIYLAPESGKKSGKEAMLEREAKAAAGQRAKWVARANANGVKPWPELTAEEHKKEEQLTREKIEKIKAAFPGMALYETHEFLFLSDMPRDQVVPFAASLDQMYDMMCQMYGIKKGTSVFKGKCMIVAFVQKADFTRFEKEFQNHVPPDFAQGLCRNDSDGHVLMSCYYGDNPPENFGQLLVHETSHGFIHRYRTAASLPSWANEGMADWLAQTLVPYHGGVTRKRELGARPCSKAIVARACSPRRKSTRCNMAWPAI